MRQALLAWFEVNARELPWRRPADRADPYRVLVAEVMLQQTQVATVVPYYHRWLERFPDLPTLAAAAEDEVLHAWQGLGYYRRALSLRRAASGALERFGGRLPGDPDALASQPGIGPYTAAAVAALAFDRPLIAVDGNVRRLACRLEGWVTPPSDRRVQQALLGRLGERAGERTAAGEAGRLAEALIELGALVCTPTRPACPRCPLAGACTGRLAGEPERYPRPAPRRAPPLTRRFALVALDGGRVWLRRRETGALLGGLWGFPQAAAAPARGRCLEPVRQVYSHFRLELVPVLVASDHPALGEAGGATPKRLDSLRALALSKVDRRVLERLAEHGLVPDAAVS